MLSDIERLADDLDRRGLPVDGALETLADRRCRNVLEFLVQEQSVAPLSDVTSHLTDDEWNDDERRSTRIQLHHVVLPKLTDVGLVEYRYDAKRVELDESPDCVDDYLQRTAKYGLS